MKIRQHEFVIFAKFAATPTAIFNTLMGIFSLWFISLLSITLVGEFLFGADARLPYSMVIVVVLILVIVFTVLFFQYRLWKNTILVIDEEAVTLTCKTKFRNIKKVIKVNDIASVNINSALVERAFKVGVTSITSKTSVGNKDDSIDVLIRKSQYQEILDYLKKLNEDQDAQAPVENSEYKEQETTEATNIIDVDSAEQYLYQKSYQLADAIVFIIIGIPRFVIMLLFYVGLVLLEVFTSRDTGAFNIVVAIFGITNVFSIISSVANLDIKVLKNRKILHKTSFLSEQSIDTSLDDIMIVHETRYNLWKKYAYKIGVVNSSFSEDSLISEPIFSLFVNNDERKEIVDLFELENQSRILLRPSKFAVRRNIAKHILLLFIIITISVLSSIYIHHAGLFGLVFVPVLLGHYICSAIAYKKYNYVEMTDKHLILSKGFIFNDVTYCDLKQVESYGIKHGPIARRFKVEDFVVTTFNCSSGQHEFSVDSYNKNDLNDLIDKLSQEIC